MGIEGQPVAETGQDCLAPRRNLADRLALQAACIRLQMVKGEEHFGYPLAGNGRSKLVCRTAYFRSFRQGRISQALMEVFGFFHVTPTGATRADSMIQDIDNLAEEGRANTGWNVERETLWCI